MRVGGNRRFILSLAALLVLLAGCPDWLTPSTGTDTSQATDESGHPALSEGDFPDVNPCLDRDTLPDDAAFLDVIENATQVIHIHDEYLDDDNLPAVCGLNGIDNTLDGDETGWDPSDGADVYVCYEFGTELSAYLALEGNHPEICRSNFGLESGNTFDGFPRTGFYRLDFCIEHEGVSYRVRLRAAVSGSSANKTLTQTSVEDLKDLEFFDEAGTEVTTTEQAKGLFIANPDGFTFTVRSGVGATTHLEVDVRVLCVKKQVSACPEPTEGCDD